MLWIVLADPCAAIECSGQRRYDMTLNPYNVSCAGRQCSPIDCCTTPRPTCAHTHLWPEMFDCSLQLRTWQGILNVLNAVPNPSGVYCNKAGCSVEECCTVYGPSSPPPDTADTLPSSSLHTTDTPPPPPPPPSEVVFVAVIGFAAFVAGVVVSCVLRKLCLTKVAPLDYAESMYVAMDDVGGPALRA